ncbi:MAG: uroporphyrinogen-III C-methyltransferase [Gammaproteobacteria bacterium RBG_16_57_12]|nr:MAG: uroporphyrinogen-III C-methyltransferase [Gammaproteobacteria bacterium RBG_16_57_12]
MTQDEINRLLVNLAGTGRMVVRLKGGDPFIFGRGSEEALYLREHGYNFEIVPGVTSAAGCSTYAGIPLTHRGLSHGVRIVTGHCRANEPLDLNWNSLADPDTTLVIYMGLGQINEISQKLMAAGLPGTTPAAIVQDGTTQHQRRHITTLAGLPPCAREQDFRPPSLLIIGNVVSLAHELDWFEPQTSIDMAGELVEESCAKVGN